MSSKWVGGNLCSQTSRKMPLSHHWSWRCELESGGKGGTGGVDKANLILNVCAVTSLVDLDVEVVGARATDERGDVEFTRIPGALGVPNLAVVHPHGECRVDTLKAQPELMACIMGKEMESCHVAAAFVVIDWHARRVNWKRVVEIGIMGAFAVALELPHARDIDDAVPAAFLRR